MTACAMTVGMVPMALALERGSQMQAPLGLAVIGGLVMSTFATLLVLPSVFAVVIGSKVATSPSMYPDDPDSAQYDPHAFEHVDEIDEEVVPSEDYAVWEGREEGAPPPAGHPGAAAPPAHPDDHIRGPGHGPTAEGPPNPAPPRRDEPPAGPTSGPAHGGPTPPTSGS
jgi:hypothetical protein